MERKRVLIVDDEPDIVEWIKFTLERENIDCVEAYDGEEALSKVWKEKPDLLVLDIMLPKMNGYTIAKFLRSAESYKDLPIIMLTARTQKIDMNMGEETGADEYVTKPFDMDTLIALVKKYLNKK